MGLEITRKLDSTLEQPGFDDLSRRAQDAVNAMRQAAGPVGKSVSDFLNGTWLGHSLHGTLTDFTLGTLLSAGVLDVLSLGGDEDRYGAAAEALLKLGLLSVVPTALAGLADWQYLLPRGRRFGFLHALTNTTSASLLTASLLMRRGRDGATPVTAAILSGAGLATMMAGAYLGGELVYRFGIGVSQVARLSPIEEFTPAIEERELQEGKPHAVEVAGRSVLIVRHRDRIYALDNICAHEGCELAGGSVGDGTVRCPCHGSTFRLSDGSIVTGPTTAPQHAYETRVREGTVEVRSSAGVWMS